MGTIVDNFWNVYLALVTFLFLSAMRYPHILIISYILFTCLFVLLMLYALSFA